MENIRKGGTEVSRKSVSDQAHGRRTWPVEQERNLLSTLSMALQHFKSQMRSLTRRSFSGKVS
ncbi:hypothetical protein HID58_090067 [Brassica napus]|uniref:Uncharacterized protein n=1 Tax=Brassica napus TaxID=3708 RepID=A0ABQ7XGE5_BRANA|nr:hypothetical protein HID58_090067 [Brassica napus]